MKYYLLLFVSFFSINFYALIAQNISVPNSFDEVINVIPTVKFEVRYYGSHNFIGRRIDGYQKPKVFLTKKALVQLKKVQEELRDFGLGIKIFDAYRPQQAVNHFVRWAKNEKDTLMKTEFYPNVKKKDLFRLDYIASKSGHSRGSTIDLTLILLETGEELDMGSVYDFFGKISWPFYKNISKEQKAHRMLLQTLMLSNGFKPYVCEWWHFTLKNEPFPDTYFDFEIK